MFVSVQRFVDQSNPRSTVAGIKNDEVRVAGLTSMSNSD